MFRKFICHISIFFLLFAIYLFSSEIDCLENPDNIIHQYDAEAEDSLYIQEDSLQIILDSLIYRKPAHSEIDTTDYNIKNLKKDVHKYIFQKREIRKDLQLPFLFYNENFHLKAPFEPDIHFIKNGFSIIPFKISNTHILQNYLPFLNTYFKRNFIHFKYGDYNFPVAITESFLGLGDIDMNHAAVSFSKGRILNLKNINLEANYIGQDGLFLRKNEKSRNLFLHLFNVHNWGTVHFYFSLIDQDISSNKLLSVSEYYPEKIKERTSDSAVILKNKLVDIGLRYEKSEIEDETRKQVEILFKKYLSSANNYFSGSLEYFWEFEPQDSSFYVLTLDQESDIISFLICNSASYTNNENYFLSSVISRKIFDAFYLKAKYLKSEYLRDNFDRFIEKIGTGICYNNNMIYSEIIYGQQETPNNPDDFIELINNFDIRINNINFRIENWTYFLKNRNNTLKLYPEWQIKTLFEITYNLKYNNAIKAGLSHLYCSEYEYILNDTDQTFENDTSNFDSFLIFKITDFFEIRLDVINLTNSKEMFNSGPDSIPGRHVNFSVNWIFIN